MIVRRCAISLLFVASSQAFLPAGPSLPPRSCETAAFLARPSATELGYANDDNAPLISLTEDELREANSIEASDSQTQQRSAVPINDDPETVAVRTNLKKRLAICSIENFDYDNYNRGEEKAGVAEDIMKDLEPIRPWDRPASDPGLNARFSFVFTGVPTIGMKLITLLSRISVGFPVVDFRDVFLEVSEHNTKAKAIVTAKIFGQDMELNVLTDLEVDETCEKGTMMFETFDKITIQGFTVPTPESWSRTRTLEVTYLDDDMMIARTAGGEPHFLLRHSTCSTDDDSCDIDLELTQYFEEARAKYGEQIARCLVDRDYAQDNECGERSGDVNPLATIMSFKPGSLFGFDKK